MTRSPRGDEGEHDGNDTTWSATQVGARRVEAGLGGNDDGAWGSTRGRKQIDFYANWADWQCQNRAHSVVFVVRRLIFQTKGNTTRVEQRLQKTCDRTL